MPVASRQAQLPWSSVQLPAAVLLLFLYVFTVLQPSTSCTPSNQTQFAQFLAAYQSQFPGSAAAEQSLNVIIMLKVCTAELQLSVPPLLWVTWPDLHWYGSFAHQA